MHKENAKTCSDRELARRVALGDADACAAFLDRFGPGVLRLAHRYTFSEADAEDLTQDIMVDQRRASANFRGAAKPSTWVYRVAVNHCLKRRERAKPPGLTLEEDHLRGASTLPTNDPQARAEQAELAGEAEDALESLSDLHRDVVILHEMHGLTYAECADALQIPVGTVKSRLSNAFGRLRVRLAAYVLSDEAPRTASAPARPATPAFALVTGETKP